MKWAALVKEQYLSLSRCEFPTVLQKRMMEDLLVLEKRLLQVFWVFYPDYF